MMDAQQNPVAVDSGRVIAALRKQIADLSLNLAMMTARADEAEERAAAAERERAGHPTPAPEGRRSRDVGGPDA